ncbi:cupin domain-containing protein [Teredinibacter haidensis]|uniref:cupin domain-containing protein n=1 Tax=Teredinibacter haidensis TaxID=2731755 RepID=UPI000948B174|nr:cupin domain-containing protein [Teredinibacter haidensis]
MDSSHPFPRLNYLGDMPIDTFLEEYWQKKPLLVRQAIPHFVSPLSADELAGLSLEEDVVSRLIVQGKQKNDWSLQHGPLTEDTFANLPDDHWTLLVQHADLLEPDVNRLLEAFRFLPRWRLDDIMISYASDGGGVGPHFDYYDVFLLQAKGKRRWRLGQTCSTEDPLIPGIDLKILQRFETSSDWLVEPGDLLYIPPNLAHWGEAVGDDCITYSIGFRAPSYGDVLIDFAQEMASMCSEDKRYSDSEHKQQALSGEITAHSLEAVSAIIHRFSQNKNYLASWLGEYMTRPNPGGEEASQGEFPVEQLSTTLCKLTPFARCAFYNTSDHCIVFINGHRWHCSKPLAIMLSNGESILYSQLDTKDQYILKHLAEDGLLEYADE